MPPPTPTQSLGEVKTKATALKNAGIVKDGSGKGAAVIGGESGTPVPPSKASSGDPMVSSGGLVSRKEGRPGIEPLVVPAAARGMPPRKQGRTEVGAGGGMGTRSWKPLPTIGTPSPPTSPDSGKGTRSPPPPLSPPVPGCKTAPGSPTAAGCSTAAGTPTTP